MIAAARIFRLCEENARIHSICKDARNSMFASLSAGETPAIRSYSALIIPQGSV